VADHQVQDLMPEEVSKGMAEGRYLLVDVREPNEARRRGISRRHSRPAFDLRSRGPFPIPKAKEVVFACRSGKTLRKRPRRRRRAAGLPYDKHLAGGILGWKQAGLPTKNRRLTFP